MTVAIRGCAGRAAVAAGVAAALALAPRPASAQRPAPIRIAPLSGHLHLLTGPGGNSLALTGPDGVLLIDQQFPSPTPAVMAALRSVTRERVRYVLRPSWTEPPSDPASGWSRGGATVVAHEALRDRAAASAHHPAPGATSLAGPTGAGPATGLSPDIAFSHVIALALNGEDVHAVYNGPGHAAGDVLVHFHGLNVIYAGALFTSDGYPAIDVEAGGSIDSLIAVAGQLLAAAGARTAIVPGRGPVSDRAGLAAYRAMLVAVRERVRAQIAAGRSLEQVLAGRPTAAFDRRWGRGPVTPRGVVEAVYRSLATSAGP